MWAKVFRLGRTVIGKWMEGCSTPTGCSQPGKKQLLYWIPGFWGPINYFVVTDEIHSPLCSDFPTLNSVTDQTQRSSLLSLRPEWKASGTSSASGSTEHRPGTTLWEKSAKPLVRPGTESLPSHKQHHTWLSFNLTNHLGWGLFENCNFSLPQSKSLLRNCNRPGLLGQPVPDLMALRAHEGEVMHRDPHCGPWW